MTARAIRAAVTALVGAGYVALLVAALLPAASAFLVVAAVLLAAELVLSRRFPETLPERLSVQLGARFRVLSIDVLSAVLAARTTLDGDTVALVVVAVLTLQLGRDAGAVLRRRIGWLRAGGPVSWRNLAVAGLPTPRPYRPTPALDVAMLAASLLLPIGAVLTGAGAARALFVAALLVLGIVVAVLGVRTVQWRLAARTDFRTVRRSVRAAVKEARPQVLVHFSGRRDTTDALLRWLPSVTRLRQRVLVVVREAHHLEPVAASGLPVVFAPLANDVEMFCVRSVALALYPTITANINNHLLRVTGVFDVFIGAGDSDEPQNSSPVARMYDQVWVAGPLGRARYGAAASGVRAGAVREIGQLLPADRRPAPAPPLPAAEGRRTVMVLPAWEGVNELANRSTLPQAAPLVTALTALPGVRVLYAPAPAAGSRLRPYAELDRAAAAAVRRAGAPHAVVGRDVLVPHLGEAALVVTDLGVAVTDAIAADRPYALPAHPALDAAAQPTLAGGRVLAADLGDLAAVLGEAMGEDPLAPARAALRERVFGPGPVGEGFEERFQAAVDEALAEQRHRRSFDRPSVPT